MQNLCHLCVFLLCSHQPGSTGILCAPFPKISQSESKSCLPHHSRWAFFSDLCFEASGASNRFGLNRFRMAPLAGVQVGVERAGDQADKRAAVIADGDAVSLNGTDAVCA